MLYKLARELFSMCSDADSKSHSTDVEITLDFVVNEENCVLSIAICKQRQQAKCAENDQLFNGI